MDELAKRFADLAEQYGPQVADAAKQAVRVEAYSYLMASLVWLAAAALLIWCGRFLWRRAAKDEYYESLLYFGAVVAMVTGTVCTLPALWTWIDPWTWTALARPELWLAKKAFHL